MLCTIIGAGPGLGAALGRRFGKGGYRVAIVTRNRKAVDDLTTSLERIGIETRGFLADASLPTDLDKAFDEIKAWGGRTDVLIYNVAAMHSTVASDLTPGQALHEMEINFGGAIRSVNNVLPAMRARKAGSILFTGGGLALEPYPEWASLAAGKAALRVYSIALHKQVALEGIHVAAIAVCGIIEAGGPFDPDLIAEAYWNLHSEKPGAFSRELIYLPKGADPFYNDAHGTYRELSEPIVQINGVR